MEELDNKDEQALLSAMANGSDTAFRKIFDYYYRYMVVVAYRYLNDSEKAKDFAQDAFVELWNRRATLKIKTGVKSYLRQATVNKCLNYIKREKRMDFSAPEVLPERAEAPTAQTNIEAADLNAHLQEAIQALPQKCRVIFTMSRFEEKSHKEIAAALGISTKTIENQMTKALKALRAALAQYSIWIYLFLKFFPFT